MIIVAGHLIVAEPDRDRYVESSAELVGRARATEGCVDLSITADSVDPTRVNNLEVWSSQHALDDFRASANPPDTGIEIVEASMKEYVVSRTREPFGD